MDSRLSLGVDGDPLQVSVTGLIREGREELGADLKRFIGFYARAWKTLPHR